VTAAGIAAMDASGGGEFLFGFVDKKN